MCVSAQCCVLISAQPKIIRSISYVICVICISYDIYVDDMHAGQSQGFDRMPGDAGEFSEYEVIH